MGRASSPSSSASSSSTIHAPMRATLLLLLSACTSLYTPSAPHPPTLPRRQTPPSLAPLSPAGARPAPVAGAPAARAPMQPFLPPRRWGSVLILAGSIAATAGAVYLIAKDDASGAVTAGLLGGGT